MSTPKELFNEVVSILTNDAPLSAYVDQIYERERDSIDEGNRVVIMVEPSEVWQISPYWPTQEVFVIAIIGWVVEPDPGKAINDGATKQVLDLAFDIKYALGGYPTLNAKCDSYEFYTVKYDRRRRAYGAGASLRQPPLYGVEMFMEIFYGPNF